MPIGVRTPSGQRGDLPTPADRDVGRPVSETGPDRAAFGLLSVCCCPWTYPGTGDDGLWTRDASLFPDALPPSALPGGRPRVGGSAAGEKEFYGLGS